MRITYHSSITRYAGEYPSLSAFLLSPAPSESDSESFSFSTEGRLVGKEEAFTLSYREQDGTAVTLVLREDGALLLRRGTTEASFSVKAVSSFLHKAELLELSITAYTVEISCKRRGESRLVTLVYYSHFSNIVQKNTMRWKLS